jgi:hypothetical protein
VLEYASSDMTQARELRQAAAELATLDDAVRWALRQDPRLEPVDVIIQDEYSHDVLFRAQDGSFLVFDTT